MSTRLSLTVRGPTRRLVPGAGACARRARPRALGPYAPGPRARARGLALPDPAPQA